MPTDLNTPPPEVADNNSLREVLLFCLVLVVEVYSLAVAFGGPFFEVGYFLLVVISQTLAGAYIWAQLRRTDKTLPLPELLAMGFAIGSASAAISQLIIRDLLGIRLFISPLVPIIGVAMWLVTRRNPQLPVTITHANTNTLLWLLFPAPLAMSFHEWRLYALFVIPILIAVLVFYKKQIFRTRYLLISVALLSLVFGVIIRATSSVSIANGLIGYDEIFDEAIAIGFSNWGINDHIGRAGDSFAYYKLSHVWLGPILELNGASPMIISTSVMPLIIFTFIGLSLWAVSFQIFKSSYGAGVSSVLIFLQNSLIEPDNLAIRVAQCLAIVYLLTGLIALMKAWSYIFQESLVVALVFFVLISTRTQFGIIVLAGYLLHKTILFFQRKISFRYFVWVITAVVLSLVSIFLIFLNEPAHQIHVPNQNSIIMLIWLLISSVSVRSIIPLLTIKRSKNYQLDLLLVIILSSVPIFFLIPLKTLGSSSSLTIALLVSVLIAQDVRKLYESLARALLVSIFVLAAILGFLLRLVYDLFKWTDGTNRGFLKPFVKLATDSKYVALYTTAPFMAFIIILLLWMKIKQRPITWRPIVLLSALSMSFGIWVATTFRSVTSHYRYDIELAVDIEPDSPMSWYVDTDRLDALEWMRKNTERDDIFAQNTSLPDYRSTAYSASLILSGAIHRRAFIEGTYSPELHLDYPRDVKLQTPRLKEQLQRLDTSYYFPISPSAKYSTTLRAKNVKWFVVDLGNTELRDWEPWATTRFMNEKVAILQLNHPSDGDS